MGCALSTGGSGAERGPTPAERTPKMGRAEKKLRRTGMSKTGNGENHIFKEKIFRKNRLCGVCSENIDSLGSFCKECKMAIHKKCELKVTAPCVLAPLSDTERQSTAPARHIQHVGSTRSLTSIKQRSTLPRSFSLDRVMDRVMERAFDFDLTYITERIISVFFPPLLEEQRYHANLQEVADMLKSKHQNNFLLFNLSEKRNDLTRISPKLHDFGWPDLHAPPLDRICAICKAMEGWLTSDPQHVVVLHCKGHKGKTGVIIAAYMHYSKISAGADQALSTLAMRKFCEDKLSTSLQPSQNRYIYYFGGLLSGAIKMNSSPLFLHQVLIPSLTSFHPEGGYFPFLKIYQSMQLVYTSGVYDLQGSGSRRLCVTIEPALLLKGDIMVKCYHRQAHITERETVFRLQFHTCTIHGAQLWFGKEELDEACSDDRFPSDATVEFVFSYGPEKIPGREYQRNHPAVTVDYNTADPVVRWDSYENFNLRHQDSLEDISHTRGPLDGSLYAQVKKRRGPGSGGLSPSNGDPSSVPSSPSPCPEDVLRPLPPTRQEREEFDCLLSGADSRKMRGRERERETAILDDSDAVPSERGRGMALGRRRSCRCSVGCEEPGCDGPVFLPNGCCPKTSNGHLVPPVLDLCQHHHPAMPPPELLWERQQAPSPCIQGSLSDRPSRRLCPCPAQELPLPPHAHTLPTPRLLYKGDGYTPILHHYAHMHHPHPSSPYREMMLLDVPAHPGCLCRDCRCRREESAAAVKAFHSLRLDQGEGSYYSREAEFLHREAELRRGRNVDLEWDREAELQREAGLRRGRDVAHHWDRHREAEMQWEREVESRHRRSTLAPYGPQHSPHGLDPSGFIFDPLPSGHPAYPEASHCHSYAYSHSHMDPKYNSASSGYQTPTPPYPCGPYHPSPSESRGYASGYQSESTSPLPNHGQSTASLGQAAEASDDPPSSGPHPQVRPSDCHTDGTGDVRDSMSWQEDVSQSSLKQDMRSTPSDVSDPPTPSHSSSTLPTQESPVEAEVVVRDADTVTVSVPQKGPQDLNNACPGPQQGHPASPDSHKPSLAPTIMLQRESPNQAHTSHTQVPTAVVSTKPIENPETSTLTQAPSESVLDPLPDPQTLSPGSGTALLVNASTSPKERSLESLDASPTPSSVPSSPHASSECPSSDAPVPDFPAGGRSLGAGHLQPYLDAHCSSRNPKTPSPVPDGQSTPTFPLSNYFLLNVPPVPYTGYTAVTIPAGPSQPPLPEKRHSSALCVPTVERGATLRSLSRHQGHSGPHHVTFLPSVRDSVPPVGPAEGSHRLDQEVEIRVSAKFVQDSSRFWYKPSISRDQAIAVLKDKEPGAFLIRDSSSFQGAYGLALKVATPPANSSAGGNPQDQLVRHFLIETGPRGVKIKGCQNEPYFGSLSALVYQHSITPISLPCALHIPDKDPVGELQEVQSGGNTSTAADLLRQGAACNVLYLDSVETESLTGPQAISKAINTMRSRSPRPSATVVHFKVSAQGITLTDNQRRVFFRRHYPINSVTYSSVDPQDRRWTNSDSSTSKVFGFVAKKPGSVSENVCHLFAETDPEQPATAIVNFINKVMLGPTRK